MMTPSSKLARGARVLQPECFPWLDDALATLDLYRLRFAELEATEQRERLGSSGEHWSKPFLFHPVISIFGPRGSGKTSALLTLLERIRQRLPGDLILPIIDPHRFVPGDRVLYSFLAALQPIVERFTGGASHEWMGPPQPPGLDHRREGADDLNKLFHDLAEQARWLFQSGGESAGGGSLEQRFRLHYLSRGRRFAEGLDQLVRKLTDRRLAGAGGRPQDTKSPPLMLLPIDDTDLVPEYLDEVMTFIRIVSPSLSRLVLLVTADDRLALRCTKGRYARTMFPDWSHTPDPDARLFSPGEVNEVAQGLAFQFLAKFFPDEGRFRLTALNEQGRIAFRPDDALPTLGDLLDRIGLRRFLSLDWAIKGIATLSQYASVLSGNPRLLEQAYDIVLRRVPVQGAPDLDRVRREVLTGFARLFVGDLANDQLAAYQSQAGEPSDGGRAIAQSLTNTAVAIEITPWRVLSPAPGAYPGSVEGTPRLYLFAGHEIGLRVRRPIFAGSGAETPALLPPALTLGYLALRDLQRPELADILPGLHLPSLGIDRLGPVEPTAPATGPIDLDASDTRPLFETFYPLVVAGGSPGSLYCLPMPAWRWPIQWFIFTRYWDQAAVFDPGLGEGKQQIQFLFHLVEAAIKIGRMDPLAEEPAPLGRLEPGTQALGIEAILQRLQGAYLKDITDGDGVLAEWVELGFLRFLMRVEQAGSSPFRPCGLSASRLKDLVLQVTARKLALERPLLRQDIGALVDEIERKVFDQQKGSRMRRAFQVGILLAGADTAGVGVISAPDQEFTEYGTPTVVGPGSADAIGTPMVGPSP